MKIKNICSKIIENEIIGIDVYRITFSDKYLSENLTAGQFVNVCCDKTLRRPLSIADIDTENHMISLIYQIRGEGTQILSKKQKGDIIDVVGPLGNGFDVSNVKKVLIVGGGIGSIPLLYLARQLNDADVALGFKSKSDVILEKEFKLFSKNVKIATDDGSYGYHGYVSALAKEMIEKTEYDCIYACGPIIMMKLVKTIAEENNLPVYLSLEERMACGIGACDGCVVETEDNGKTEYKKVCSDGPVFDGTKVVLK